MKTHLPAEMRTVARDNLVLPSGNSVDVPRCHLYLTKWEGEDMPTYGGKTILNYKGEALYAELVVLRILQNAGWSGVWVDTYRQKYRTGLPEDGANMVTKDDVIDSPPFVQYPEAFTKFGGCWDIVAWKDEQIIFCECKRQKQDSIRDTQLSWLEDRLGEGAKVDQFLIVEWSVDSETKA